MVARAKKRGTSSKRRTRTTRPVASVTKKVRMTEEDAARLASLASATGKTESEILREGILLAEREDKRLKAIADLVKMAGEAGPEPPKIRWAGK